MMALSHSISIAGSINATISTLIIAPLAMSMHMELIMSISEYTATPKVAANRPQPLTIMEGRDTARAAAADSLLLLVRRSAL